MKVTLEYFAQARELAGVSREVVEIDEPVSAGELVARVARKRGGRFAMLLLGSDGKVAPSVMLAVGESQISSSDARPLRDGEEIVIVPPISGGC